MNPWSEKGRRTRQFKPTRLVAQLLAATIFAATFSLLPATQASAASTYARLTQEGYIFENDDGANVNSNTQVAAGSTAITAVAMGAHLTTRFHLKNTGNALDPARNLAMFYDHGDGYWSKVRSNAPITASATNCTIITSFACGVIDNSVGVDAASSVAVNASGQVWVAYSASNTGNLIVAQYVGTGGSGCNGSSTEWSCTTVYSANFTQYASLAFDNSGTAWVAFNDNTNSDLRVARYVGSGGTGCASSAWTCTGIEVDGGTTDRGQFASIAIDSTGVPWVAYFDYTSSANDARYAQYVGTGGTGCAGATTVWTCGAVDTNNTSGENSSLAFAPDGTAYISYYQNSIAALQVARYVGTGGTGCGGSTRWTCISVDDPAGASPAVGRNSSIAFAPDGSPWIAYRDVNNNSLKVARYVTSGGSGCGSGGSTAWTCASVDTTGAPGQHNSLAFAPDGTAWVTTRDTTNSALRLARYVGSSGTGCGGGNTAWTCSNVDANNLGAKYTSLTFDFNGNAWITHNDTSNSTMRFARLNRSGEVIPVASAVGASGDNITSSHADMATTGDTSNKADADCLTGTTWNNGKWFETENATGVSVSAGNVTSQCTEIGFSIDTSRTTPGMTYRFVIAVDDGWRADKAMWRGPIAISTYPTLTMWDPTDTESVTVTAAIDPALTFLLSATSGSCNGVSQTAGISVTANSIDFGRTGAGNVVGAQDLSVTTNAASGFTAYLRSSGDLQKSGHSITNASGSNASPAAFPTAGSEGFGYTTNDATLGTGTANRFTNGGAKWAAFSGTNSEVFYVATGPTTTSTCVAVQAGIASTTPAGAYSTTLTYTVMPTF